MTKTLLNDYTTVSGEIWQFFKSHFEPVDSDDWWQETIHEADALYEKYKGTDVEIYAEKYILLCVDEIGRLATKVRERK